MKLKHLENMDKKCCETNCKECPLNHNLYKEGTCERDFADFLCNYVAHRNMTTRELIETYTNVEMPSK